MTEYPDNYADDFEENLQDGTCYQEYYLTTNPDSVNPIPGLILVIAITLVVSLVLGGVLFNFWGIVFDENLIAAQAAEKQADLLRTVENESSHNSGEEIYDEPGFSPQIVTSECSISSQYPTKITRWCPLISFYAAKHNLDPDLVAAVVWLESGGNELAYSRSGAVGLMQVMPRDGLAANFMCVNGPCFRDRPSTEELQNPEFNIAFGTKFLAGLVRRNGNLRDALRSYGPMDAGYSYSDKVLGIYNRYKGN